MSDSNEAIEAKNKIATLQRFEDVERNNLQTKLKEFMNRDEVKNAASKLYSSCIFREAWQLRGGT